MKLKKYGLHIAVGLITGIAMFTTDQMIIRNAVNKERQICKAKITELTKQLDTCEEKLKTKFSEEDVKKLVDWVMKHSSRISRSEAERIVKHVITKSKYPLLMLAIMCKESNFNPKAISKSGAIGLGQILPNKFQLDLLIKNGIIKEKRDLFEIEKNIDATDFILSAKLAKAGGNIIKALEFYFGTHNERYVKDVLKYLGELYILTKI